MRRSRQPLTFLFAVAVRGSLAPCFVGAQSPAAAAQLCVLRSFLLNLALIGVAGCIHRPHTSTGSGAERDQVALVPSPEEVVGAGGFTGITEPECVAWTKANSDSPGDVLPCRL